jgi:RimJ/RimL family protein N-acetyltransferase
MTTPTIKTDRLTLRAFTEADTDALTLILNGDDVLRYFPTTTPPTRGGVTKMITRILHHWEEKGYGLWALTLAETGQLMGRCGLQYIPETDEVEVDFILDRQFWGQSFATKAGQTSMNYGFDSLDVNSITGIVHPDNLASQRVLQKLGMQYVEATEYFGMACHRYLKTRV